MIPTFLSLQTASRALSASQACLNVTGNNISNVNTEGYTRQRVDLSSISSSGFAQKYAVSDSASNLGVEATGISQIRDTFLDSRYRNENSDNGLYETLASGLSDLESIFDEADTEGLQTQLSDFVKQLENLSNTPTSEDIALVVKTSAQTVTQMINTYAQQVSEVREQSIYDLSNVVIDNDFNTVVQNIANLNKQIKEEQIYGNTPNELLDKRNSLIDELSNMANIKVTSTPEKISENLTVESLSISIYDESTGTSIGLVDDSLYNTLSVNAEGENVVIELNSSFGAHETNDITDHFSSGSIRGYLNIINGAGTYADSTSKENTYRGTVYYTNVMNTFANTFAQTFNNLNDTDTTDTAAMPLFSTNDGTAIITAGNISISQEWLKDSSYITTSKSTSTTTTGDNDNILLMIEAMEGDINFYSDPDTKTNLVFSGTFNEYMTGTIAELSLDISLNKNFASTSNTVLSSLFETRESVSGVSLDEEGINLIAYKKSYDAAARYLTVLDEALDTLLKMGIVGR